VYTYLLLGLLWLAGCTSIAQPIPSQALAPGESPIALTLRQQAQAHPAGESGFRLLASSSEAFSARAELIRRARHSLDLQYYIVHEGLSTSLLVEELLRAADRGVRVRVLLDDTASDGRDYEIATLAAHPNIQIRVFNALHVGRSNGITRLLGRLFNLNRQHRRMHNKLWLADSSVAIVGGRNLGDEYFDAQPQLNFADIDLLAAGPVAVSLAESFDQFWNHRLSVPIQHFLYRPPSQRTLDKARRTLTQYLADVQQHEPQRIAPLLAYQQTPQLQGWLESLIWARGQALWDAPNKILAEREPDPHWLLTTQLSPHLAHIRKELLLVSAYFIPAREGLLDLTRRADQGIDVRLLTNSLEATDVPAVHGAYAPYRISLLKHGIRVFELRRQPDEESSYSFSGSSESSLHSKALVIDGEKVFIGSFNFDPRSVLWNSEVGVLVDSPALAGEVRRLTLEGMRPSISYEVQLDEQDARPRLVWMAEDQGITRRIEREPGNLWRRLNAWLADWIGLERMF
jgi:putative cardiolipin synthase